MVRRLVGACVTFKSLRTIKKTRETTNLVDTAPVYVPRFGEREVDTGITKRNGK